MGTQNVQIQLVALLANLLQYYNGVPIIINLPLITIVRLIIIYWVLIT